MNRRWIALGIVGAAVWLIATFGIVYVAVDLAGEDIQVVIEAPVAEDRECADAVVYFSAIDNSIQFFVEQSSGETAADFLGSDYTDALNQMIAACSR